MEDNNEILARQFETWQKEYYDLVDEPFRRQNKAEGEVAFILWESRFKKYLRQNLPSVFADYLATSEHFVEVISASNVAPTVHQTSKLEKGNMVEAFLKHVIVNARTGAIKTNRDSSLQQEGEKGLSMNSIKEIKDKRFQFLLTLYQKTGGSTLEIVDSNELGHELGFSDDETDKIYEYLLAEELIEGSIGPTISITHEGIVEVENVQSKPNEPTAHFPANIMYVNHMTNSQIQQGTSQSHQTLNYTHNDLEAISKFVTELRSKLPDLEVGQAAKAEIDSDLSTIETQLKSPRPKPMIIQESLRSLKTILEGATGSLLASGFLELVSQWL